MADESRKKARKAQLFKTPTRALVKPSLQQEQRMVQVKLNGKTPWKGDQQSFAPTETSEEVKVFSIHSAFLCFYSPCFAKIFSNDSVTEIGIYGVSHGSFSTFVHWLYYQDLNKLDVDPDFFGMVLVWKLAERFEIPTLQNAAMDYLHHLALLPLGTEVYCCTRWGEIFDIARESKYEVLLEFLRDNLVDTKSKELAASMLKHTSPEMMVAVVLRMKESGKHMGMPAIRSAHGYHVPV
ncbi:hypothetical protein VTL71DRAFT_1324 [Oculimacula yallundae]|uniref:BTB domain-containing protein n=1 Tax=Oculimacula yallundae TaxID=86028 RepID=A0ABR4CAC9_9HELO